MKDMPSPRGTNRNRLYVSDDFPLPRHQLAHDERPRLAQDVNLRALGEFLLSLEGGPGGGAFDAPGGGVQGFAQANPGVDPNRIMAGHAYNAPGGGTWTPKYGETVSGHFGGGGGNYGGGYSGGVGFGLGGSQYSNSVSRVDASGVGRGDPGHYEGRTVSLSDPSGLNPGGSPSSSGYSYRPQYSTKTGGWEWRRRLLWSRSPRERAPRTLALVVGLEEPWKLGLHLQQQGNVEQLGHHLSGR